MIILNKEFISNILGGNTSTEMEEKKPEEHFIKLLNGQKVEKGGNKKNE